MGVSVSQLSCFAGAIILFATALVLRDPRNSRRTDRLYSQQIPSKERERTVRTASIGCFIAGCAFVVAALALAVLGW